jgi:hypothetical protein
MSYTFTYVKKPHTNIHLEEIVAVEISSGAIERMIISGVEWMKKNPEESVWFSMTGNTLVFIVRDEDDLQIEVTERKRSGFVHLEPTNDDDLGAGHDED